MAGRKGTGLKSTRSTPITSRTNYAESGYDERDRLDGGRWMWDDRRAIRVWVATGEVA